MSYVLYGIKACDTMKKARTWLDEQGIAYQFHDYKTAGIDRGNLQKWCDAVSYTHLTLPTTPYV